MNTYQSKTRVRTVATIIAVVAVIGLVVLIEVLQHNSSTTASVPITTSASPQLGTSVSSGSTSTAGSTASTSSSSAYKDGTYTADASYYVPHGSEDITVTLTVADGVVTDSSIVNSESDHDSQRYQENFAAAYKTSVVGKSLSDLKLSYVAGASDTTDGFNDAITKIQTQAKA